jgi:ATP-GRASP peptide maturase of grasp-with-spasm system
VICIFSTAVDQSTTDVIRWLHHWGFHDVIRVNSQDSATRIRIDVSEGTFSFQLGSRTIRLQDMEAVWYRKGRHWLCDQFYPVTVAGHTRFSAYLNHKLKSEEATLAAYLHHLIDNTVPVLGSATKGNLNKLLVLEAAKKVGLLTPGFYISNHREGIGQVFRQNPDLITKAMSDGLYFFEEHEAGTGYFSYTEKVSADDAARLPEHISPSFLQQNIAKKFEVRVFFLEDTCYAMAILSQSDEQTRIDFRKYNEKKPNRYVPFILPPDIDKKIKRLFRKLDLNTGSVDLLVDEQEDYYFLEINPVGQFGMVSAPCNYFLERQVALNLIRHARHYRANRDLRDRTNAFAAGLQQDLPGENTAFFDQM